MSEYILVIPSDKRPEDLEGLKETTNRFGRWVDRDLAEQNENWLQIIPYVILRNKSSVFCYQRSSSIKEERLRNQKSIGLGGHIDKADDLFLSTDPLWDSVERCSLREVHEEVNVSADKDFNVEFTDKLIFHPDNAVGRVHLGVLCVGHTTLSDVQVRENDKIVGGFLTLKELKRIPREEFETWSQDALDFLEVFDARPTPS